MLLACVVAAFLIVGATGCEKKSGEAVVLSKEHIDAALPGGEISNAQSAQGPDDGPRPIADDEITVDGYVMKPETRGTSRDLRALKDEQWLVKVRMLDDGAGFKSTPIERNSRNCARTIVSKSGIAPASIPERSGPLRLSKSLTLRKRASGFSARPIR
jgi:hypothetical protein